MKEILKHLSIDKQRLFVTRFLGKYLDGYFSPNNPQATEIVHIQKLVDKIIHDINKSPSCAICDNLIDEDTNTSEKETRIRTLFEVLKVVDNTIVDTQPSKTANIITDKIRNYIVDKLDDLGARKYWNK